MTGLGLIIYDVNNTAPLDERRFLVYGHHYERPDAPWCQSDHRYCLSKVRLSLSWSSCLILESATWACLPPLPFAAQRIPFNDPKSFWLRFPGPDLGQPQSTPVQHSISGGNEENWRQENASVPFRYLEAPPPSCEVLSPLRELQGAGRWQITVRTEGKPRVLDLPSPTKGSAHQTVREALAVTGSLLVLSPEGAYMNGREMT